MNDVRFASLFRSAYESVRPSWLCSKTRWFSLFISIPSTCRLSFVSHIIRLAAESAEQVTNVAMALSGCTVRGLAIPSAER